MTAFYFFLLACTLFGLAILVLHYTDYGDPEVANKWLRDLFAREEEEDSE